MSQTTIFRNEEKINKQEVIKQFEKTLNQSKNYSNSIEGLVKLFAKNPTDNFIVYGTPVKQEAAQGDILIFASETAQYKTLIKTVSNKKDSDSMNLQEGNSMTGDHRVVPLKGSKVTIEECSVKPTILNGRSYPAKIITADMPFLLTHSEHGNVAFPEGTYMSCVALDPSNMTRILD